VKPPTTAQPGDFIKDTSARCRSLGYVLMVDYNTDMMLVKFPKIGKRSWVVWKNLGHYLVV
tara:strand:- start:345 stop:527 length:183 start_codon:yes stop_codon:yes gene_type:complete